jgi:hypothetical protein
LRIEIGSHLQELLASAGDTDHCGDAPNFKAGMIRTTLLVGFNEFESTHYQILSRLSLAPSGVQLTISNAIRESHMAAHQELKQNSFLI